MKYYFIRQQSDKKVVGISDGSAQAEIVESKWKNKKELKRYNEEYILGIDKIEKKIQNGEDVQPPVIEYIKVRPTAILTDFLSFSEGYSGGRFLVSDRAKRILKEHNVSCRFYEDIGLYHMDKRVEGYSNFHLLPFKAESSFVFDKCIFFTGTKFSHTKTLHHVESYDEYHLKRLIHQLFCE